MVQQRYWGTFCWLETAQLTLVIETTLHSQTFYVEEDQKGCWTWNSWKEWNTCLLSYDLKTKRVISPNQKQTACVRVLQNVWKQSKSRRPNEPSDVIQESM